MLFSSFFISAVELDQLIASYGIAEELSQNEEFLKETIELAQEVAGTPVCYISLLGSEYQYIITKSGMQDFPLLKNQSVCQFTVSNRKLTVIDDIKRDSKTCDLEAAEGEFTFYAGFPLINDQNVAIGSLCFMDTHKKDLSSSQIKILELVSKGIVEKFDTRRQLLKLIKDINKSFKPSPCCDFHCLSGELSHLQAEVLDTKKNIELEREKLKISNTSLSQFAHRVAHDIKAPLRSINSFTQLLKRNRKDELSQEKDDQYYQYINHSIIELNRMIDNLLNIAEFKSNVSPMAISISQLIDNIEIVFYDIIKTNNIKIIKPTVDVQVFGYETLIRQVFQNIISNGIKYCDKQKESFVKVSIEVLESSVLVSISDNGIGIAKEDLKTIFHPFKRVSNNQEIEGLGIGLDTCKMIVNDMGKDLVVKSELGVGSTFSFEIPIR